MCVFSTHILGVVKWMVALVLVSLHYIFLNGVNKMDIYFRKVKNFQFLPLCLNSEVKDMS